jgi:hypothetical protein
MREFFEVINEYPWTTFLLCLFLIVLAGEIKLWRD